MMKLVWILAATIPLTACNIPASNNPWSAGPHATETVEMAQANCRVVANSATAGSQSLQAAVDSGVLYRDCMIGRGMVRE